MVLHLFAFTTCRKPRYSIIVNIFTLQARGRLSVLSLKLNDKLSGVTWSTTKLVYNYRQWMHGHNLSCASNKLCFFSFFLFYFYLLTLFKGKVSPMIRNLIPKCARQMRRKDGPSCYFQHIPFSQGYHPHLHLFLLIRWKTTACSFL